MTHNNDENKKNIYLTVLSSDSFLPGVVILHESLKKHSSMGFIVLCQNTLSKETFTILSALNINYIIKDNDVLPDYIVNAPEYERQNKFGFWQNTFFKLKMFELNEYDKICYIDSDIVVAANIDNLFECQHMSAVADSDFYVKSTNSLNSGLLVFEPKRINTNEFVSTIEKIWKQGPWPYGDQDVISFNYKNWVNDKNLHLDVSYNACFSRLHKYKTKKIKVYHYANHYKPWDMKYGYLILFTHSLIHLRHKTC